MIEIIEKQNFEPTATGASEKDAQSRGPEAQASTEKPSDRAEAMTRRLGGKGIAEGLPTTRISTDGSGRVYNVIYTSPGPFGGDNQNRW